MRCEPASTIIEKLGGLTVVATACGLDVSSVLRWRLPKKRGGTGGLIPAKHQAKLVGLGAQPSEFIPGLAASATPVAERAAS